MKPPKVMKAKKRVKPSMAKRLGNALRCLRRAYRVNRQLERRLRAIEMTLNQTQWGRDSSEAKWDTNVRLVMHALSVASERYVELVRDEGGNGVLQLKPEAGAVAQ